MSPEEQARQQIDAMLAASGWAIQDYKAFNPSAARGIALHEVPLKSGRCHDAPFSQRGGLGRAHELFGDKLPDLLNELNTILAA